MRSLPTRAVLSPPTGEGGTLRRAGRPPGRRDRFRRLRLQVGEIVGRTRGRHLLVLDSIGITLAACAAISLHNLGKPVEEVARLAMAVALVLAVRTIIDIRSGLYTHGWRFASVPDMERIIVAVVLGTIISASLLYATNFVRPVESFPVAFWPIEMLGTLFVLGGSRFAIRAASDMAIETQADSAVVGRRTLLYGAGRIGVMMARSAQRKPAAGVLPVGFLDDEAFLAGATIAGLRVFGGLSMMEGAVRETGAVALLITMSEAPGVVVRAVGGSGHRAEAGCTHRAFAR